MSQTYMDKRDRERDGRGERGKRRERGEREKGGGEIEEEGD